MQHHIIVNIFGLFPLHTESTKCCATEPTISPSVASVRSNLEPNRKLQRLADDREKVVYFVFSANNLIGKLSPW